MARILAVDWDQHEVRYVVAATKGKQLTLRAAASVPLAQAAAEESGEESGGAADVGEALRAALQSHVGRGVTTLVSVDRGSVEVLELTLPPAQDAELAELVSNQAMREFQTVAEGSVLDFVPLNEDPGQPRQVTAFSLSPEQRQHFETIFAAAKITPRRMLLRPYATAALLRRLHSQIAFQDTSLLINRVGDTVDLAILSQGKVTFSRTVRLPTGLSEENRTERLLPEINRTLLIASSDEENEVKGVYLFGRTEDYPSLTSGIHDELELPVTVVDPFASLQKTDELPDDLGRFAPLVGMVVEEAGGRSHPIDFLNPRKLPKPVNRWRAGAAAAAVLVTVLLIGSYYVWDTLATLDEQNDQLAQRLQDLDELVEHASHQEELVEEIRHWNATNVNWLDELRDFSLRFPPSRDAMVLRMSLNPGRAGGGLIDLQGVVRDPSVVLQMEHNVRDEFHEVRSNRVQERVQEKSHAWYFETSVVVAKREKSQYISHRSEAEVAQN